MVIPGSVASIGTNAFYGCGKLKTVTLPYGLGSIAQAAFENCTNLLSVVAPGSVTNIGSYAFQGCTALTSVTLPTGVTTIAPYTFYDCLNLTNVAVPNGATSIGPDAFGYCSRLQSVSIPASVTSLGNYAFYYCNSLTSVYFQGNAPSPGLAFYPFSSTAYYLPGCTWSSGYPGLHLVQWYLPNPTILNFEPSLGIATNGFGFVISWATNASVVVQACTNLATPVWFPVQTNSLTNGSCYFSESLKATFQSASIASLRNEPGVWLRRELSAISAVTVRHHPASTAAATLLVGWLASRLGWRTGPLAPDGDALVGATHGEDHDVTVRAGSGPRAAGSGA